LAALQHIAGVKIAISASKEAFVDLNIDIHLFIYNQGHNFGVLGFWGDRKSVV
jgi:hypothetical protein